MRLKLIRIILAAVVAAAMSGQIYAATSQDGEIKNGSVNTASSDADGKNLKGASLTPSAKSGSGTQLGLKSGVVIKRPQGSRIEIKNGRTYTCKGNECAAENRQKH